MPGTNALAYYEKSYLTAVKSFITLATGGGAGLGYVSQVLSVKNHKITNNSTTTEARQKKAQIWNFCKIFDLPMALFKINQILLTKISHRLLVTIK